MTLPKGVHRVVSRGREYFYFQPGRNTKGAKERIKLPSDPQSPEFWTAIRQARGEAAAVEPRIATFGMVLDEYIEWLAKRPKITAETKRKYNRSIDVIRRVFGAVPAADMRTKDVFKFLDEFTDVPGTANNLLSTLRAISKWAVVRGHLPQPITDGIKPNASDGGHKPWTAAQCLAAERGLTDMVRRAYFLARYTGQRGSDVVRLNPGMIDEGGFRIVQQKTSREVWCPIEDRLAAEMATWDKELGPYLKQHWGKVYGRKLLDKQFRDQASGIPELAGVTFHGLRGTRVVELRQRGATSTQIQDQVGMSLAMIERYCRFADKKANGKASVVALKRSTQ